MYTLRSWRFIKGINTFRWHLAMYPIAGDVAEGIIQVLMLSAMLVVEPTPSEKNMFVKLDHLPRKAG